MSYTKKANQRAQQGVMSTVGREDIMLFSLRLLTTKKAMRRPARFKQRLRITTERNLFTSLKKKKNPHLPLTRYVCNLGLPYGTTNNACVATML